MSVIYGNMNVDEKYSPLFEPNLYYGDWMVPGVTYTDKYQVGPAGGYYVHKLNKGEPVVPGLPGQDFVHELAGDDLIQIILNNSFRKSRKLYNVQAAAIEAPVAEQLMADTTKLVRQSINGSGIAALINEGTASAETAAITADNVKQAVIDARASMVEGAAASAKIILASPKTYAAMLAAFGRDFVPNTNERIQTSGLVGNWYGFTVIECAHLASKVSYTYRNYAGIEKTVSPDDLAKINFILYDPEAFSALTNLAMYRITDQSVDFNGSLSQAEVNMGFRVTNPELVYIHKNA